MKITGVLVNHLHIAQRGFNIVVPPSGAELQSYVQVATTATVKIHYKHRSNYLHWNTVTSGFVEQTWYWLYVKLRLVKRKTQDGSPAPVG